MRSEIKYLSIGFIIGICATALLLTGMLVPQTMVIPLPTETITVSPTLPTSTLQPTSTVLPPTNTYTSTPTLINPTLTATLTNTPTVTPTVPSPTPTFADTLMGLLQVGYLSQVGPLSLKDQLKVYEASLKYVRTSTEESLLIGEQINGPGYGAPSNICGPLSIAILQDAGLIEPELDPHAFWLLNAKLWDDRRLLARAFPPEEFENMRVQVRLNKVDWNNTPLYPGDFIYIYAGAGNFEHMLLVNRIDSEGRAYSVTNHNTDNGFIISEVLLYDPDNPNVGMFPVWAERPNRLLGATGFGGFEVWRMRAP